MERRAGPEYDFNDPLLEDLLKKLEEHGAREVLLAQLLLSPGRHDGKNRDLAKICQGFGAQSSKLPIHRLPTMGNHPLILDILADRISRDR